MGHSTPEGVTAKINENKPVESRLADLPSFDLNEETLSPSIEIFLQDLDTYAQSGPEGATFAAGLIREIYDVTGIIENNPDDSALGASRVDVLNAAVQSSNAPAELKADAQNIFGSDESQQTLLQIASLARSGSGLVERFGSEGDSETEKERRDREDFAMAAAEAGRAAAASAIAGVFAGHRQDLDEAGRRLRERLATGKDDTAALKAYADDVLPVAEEALAEANKVNPDHPDDNLDATLATVDQEMIGQGISDPAQREVVIAELRKALDGNVLGLSADVKLGSSSNASLITRLGLGITPAEGETVQLDTKADIERLIAEGNARFESSMEASELELASLEQSITDLRAGIADNRLAIDNALGIREAVESAKTLNEQSATLDELTTQLTNQKEILQLQKDVHGLTSEYTKALLDKLDSPADIDTNFLKQAIINTPRELALKSQELLERTGNEGNDPISLMKAMAQDPDNGLSDDKRQEITQFLSDLEGAGNEIKNIAELQAKIEEQRAALEEERAIVEERIVDYEQNSGGDFLVPRGPVNGRVSPMMAAANDPDALGTQSYYIEMAERNTEREIAELEQQMAEAQQRYNDLVGIESDDTAEVAVSAALAEDLTDAPAPTPPTNTPTPKELAETILAGRDQISALEIADYLKAELNLSGAELDLALHDVAAEFPENVNVTDLPYTALQVDLYADMPEPVAMASAEPEPAQPQPSPQDPENNNPSINPVVVGPMS